MRSPYGLIVVAFLAFLAPALAAEDGAAVKITPAAVSIRTFDPRHPTAEMPHLNPDEAAVTESGFGCEVQIAVETTTQEGAADKTKITGVSATTKLTITEWLPTRVTAKIRAHEDGHRKVAEFFYGNADKTANELARKYLGREVERRGGEDVQAAIGRVANEFCQEYLSTIEGPSQRAQERYDQITDHGRNRVPEATAVKKSVEGAGG
jgi:hypothetical protein